MTNSLSDLRHAVRGLRRTPGFALAALVTLALGIGANTAVFSVVDGVLLRPLPYPDPDRLAYLTWEWGGGGRATAVSYTKYAFWREHARTLSGVTTFRAVAAQLGGDEQAIELQGQRVDDAFFDVFGVTPVLGRAFAPDEYVDEGPTVVVLAHHVWQSQLGGDPRAIGRSIQLEGRAYVVVGVLPRGFRLVESTGNDFLLPRRIVANPEDGSHNALVVARLAPGATQQTAEAEMGTLSERFREAYPSLVDDARERMRLADYASIFVGDLRTTLFILLGAVGFVLLIACANVANLLLARSADRRREIAIRAAIGASRSRITAQLLTESITLALLAGVIGVLLGAWTVDALVALAPATLPRAEEIGLDARVLAFALGAAALTGILFGLASAVPVVRGDLTRFLKDGDRGAAGHGSRRLRSLLVVTETAVATILLAGASLLIASFAKLRSVDPGFEPGGVIAASFGRIPASHDAQAVLRFQEQALSRLRARPTIDAAATTANLPLERGMNLPITVVGKPEATEGAVEWRSVSTGYFDVLGIATTAGRTFAATDDGRGRPVVIVNESFARHYFPSGNALGQQVAIGSYRGEQVMAIDEPARTIVGVVADVKEISLDAPPRRTVFVPEPQVGRIAWGPPRFLLRSSTPGRAIADARAVFREADARMPTPEFRMLDDVVGASLAYERFSTLLMTMFAGLALVLTAVGLYGVLSYVVRQRTREIGIRMALGATRTTILRMVLRHGLGLTAAGLGIGLVAGIALTRLLTAMLFDVRPTDPLFYIAVTLLLTGVAALASWLPARRAVSVAPIVTLRAE